MTSLLRLVTLSLLCATLTTASAQDRDLLKRLNKDTTSVVTQATKSTVGIQIGRAYGSGFAIGKDLVMTSTDVTQTASSNIYIYFHDASVARGQVVAIDQALCAVLIKVHVRRPMTPLKWSKSYGVGTGVFTLGNPYGTILTTQQVAASFGNISGRYRVQGDKYYGGDVLEITAAVNRGSFGGPVITTAGELVGMVHRSVSYKRWFGVAIPGQPLQDFVRRYRAGKTSIQAPPKTTESGQLKPKPASKIPGFLGVKVKGVERRGRSKRVYRTVQITAVAPDSPAAQAGLKAGDWVMRVNRLPVRSERSFALIMSTLRAGQTIRLEIYRSAGNRQPISKKVTLSTPPW